MKALFAAAILAVSFSASAVDHRFEDTATRDSIEGMVEACNHLEFPPVLECWEDYSMEKAIEQKAHNDAIEAAIRALDMPPTKENIAILKDLLTR